LTYREKKGKRSKWKKQTEMETNIWECGYQRTSRRTKPFGKTQKPVKGGEKECSPLPQGSGDL